MNSIKKILSNIDGVEKYEVSLKDGEAVIEFDPVKTSIEKIEKKFEKTPYKIMGKVEDNKDKKK
ncbi:MAG: heavy metal-associated domain-containing protein [Melioribacteraceae bacterium]